MSTLDQLPVASREKYAWMIDEMVKYFLVDKRSGEFIVRLKEGIPAEVEPHPRIRLDK